MVIRLLLPGLNLLTPGYIIKIMEIIKSIKANIIYYYLAALVFVVLIMLGVYVFPLQTMGYHPINFYIILPFISIVLGFVAGGAKSYVKWGFPVYMALLSFFLSVMVYGYENWWLVLIGFGVSLIGVVIRHLIRSRMRDKRRSL